MSREHDEHAMGTADLVAATEDPRSTATPDPAAREPAAVPHPAAAQGEQLAALFPPDMAQAFRERWASVQIGFVDDPRGAVQQADELVAKVMKSLAERFAQQRASIESDVGQNDQASTENMRVALRSYRSFFERLLSL